MNVIETNIAGVKIIEPKVFGDDRGYFCETWNQQQFETLVAGKPTHFVQDNHSKSVKGTLRGLHFQRQQTQGKLIRVISGEIFDVAVDIRTDSPTYGQWVGVLLSADNKRQVWIPAGFAHGFYVLSDFAECVYKCTDYYHPQSEETILWNDAHLDIKWPVNDAPLLSDKDQHGHLFKNIRPLV
ncbi:dTDP-4-dehydrorhamnose 3,5-epimerase [Shewanella glacialimarina]|uniref:dTDP-4-dehydrorhamnose 3,5-epimerase n=1 Tax=Shewanella glacialimarina TaxID=2590884 RepID=UPI001CF7FC1C|nr:dTDP-4-dehydrorhamnose 3,5-epimerase [Shewanella glacialimarina]UCX04005.1 dTDP-4-dehydrorhamnose 3,5-epimerase [Shewanella glacialimarina]